MKKAICFGINNYPGEKNDLFNCVNDALDWSQFFKSLGFTVEVFFDSDVTELLFRSKIRTLIAEAQPGDHIAITYSGHGTQIFDTSKDEADGYDEAICLYDKNLPDDEIAAMLKYLKDGVNCFLNFDSCFSGSATRSANGTKIKFRKTTDIPINKLNRRRKAFGKNLIDMKEIYLSGCSDAQYSYDAAELFNGAETYYALSTFVKGMTFIQWYKAIRKKLPSSKYPQTPQLEGAEYNLNKVAFGCLETYTEPKGFGGSICDFIKKLFHY